ncbi:hypothetical protein [Fictibacillus halophilus]|uniref:hypothetical protein n=1 Tax=Fictibacillus halophilus TaxID=1610490 RepID=UPI001CF94A61|nr:hypothetical protein [Fictibacillus halophilus]
MAFNRRKKRKEQYQHYSWFDFFCDVLFFVPELLIWMIRLLGRGIWRMFDGI